MRQFVAVDIRDYMGYFVCRSSPTGEANRLNEGVSGGGPAGNATGWIIKNKSALKRSSMRATPKPSVLPVDSNVKMVNGAAEGRGQPTHNPKGSAQAHKRQCSSASKQARIVDQSSSAQARERSSASPDSVTAELG